MDRGTLIRSAFQPDFGSILHSRHQYHWHTVTVPPLTVAAPHIWCPLGWPKGIWTQKKMKSSLHLSTSASASRGGRKEELKAFTTGLVLPVRNTGPMNLPYPEQAVKSVQPPEGMEPGRFSNLISHFKKLIDQNPDREKMSDFPESESMLRSMNGTPPAPIRREKGFRPDPRARGILRGLRYPFWRGCLLSPALGGTRSKVCRSYHRVCSIPALGSPMKTDTPRWPA